MPAWANPSSHPGTKLLRFGVHVGAKGTLDPHFAADYQDRAFADMVFKDLARYQPGRDPQIEPDLAEHFPRFIFDSDEAARMAIDSQKRKHLWEQAQHPGTEKPAWYRLRETAAHAVCV